MKILHICPTFESKTCGIGAYTRNLCAGIKKVSSVDQAILNGFSTIYQALLEQKPSVVHLQLEYSFCSPQRLMLFDSYCHELKIPLFVTFHTLGIAPHNTALKYATKLAHTPLSKDYGVFTLIPSGIPEITPATLDELSDKFLEKERHFVNESYFKSYLFFGQAHRHKQLLETLLEFKENKVKRLVCVVSKPVQGDLSCYDECYNLAKTLSNVCWIENYLDDHEVLTISTLCSTALFPYTEYGSIGISAAVKLLLNNNNIKIYTSFASHFSDISEELMVVTKFHTVQDMLAVDIPHDREMRQEWVRQNNFSEVGKIHLSLYEDAMKGIL